MTAIRQRRVMKMGGRDVEVDGPYVYVDGREIPYADSGKLELAVPPAAVRKASIPRAAVRKATPPAAVRKASIPTFAALEGSREISDWLPGALYALGDVIVYTGEGGQDGFGGRQVKDQTFTGGNAALVTSHELGLPS